MSISYLCLPFSKCAFVQTAVSHAKKGFYSAKPSRSAATLYDYYKVFISFIRAIPRIFHSMSLREEEVEILIKIKYKTVLLRVIDNNERNKRELYRFNAIVFWMNLNWVLRTLWAIFNNFIYSVESTISRTQSTFDGQHKQWPFVHKFIHLNDVIWCAFSHNSFWCGRRVWLRAHTSIKWIMRRIECKKRAKNFSCFRFSAMLKGHHGQTKTDMCARVARSVPYKIIANLCIVTDCCCCLPSGFFAYRYCCCCACVSKFKQ